MLPSTFLVVSWARYLKILIQHCNNQICATGEYYSMNMDVEEPLRRAMQRIGGRGNLLCCRGAYAVHCYDCFVNNKV